MKSHARALFAFVSLWPVVAGTQQPPSADDPIERFKGVLRDATSDVERFETNGFRVEAETGAELGADLKPTGRSFAALEVSADGIFRVGIEKGRDGMSRGGGVALFHRASGWPMLSVGDRDGDGRIDILEYEVLDEQGAPVMSVVDYEADGQPDMRIHSKEHFWEIWHVDRWYRVERRVDHPGIVVDGKFVELEKRDNRWVVPGP